MKTGVAKCPDTDLEWYDFGSGWEVSENTIVSTKPCMVALTCVRDGKYYHKCLYGEKEDFTEEKLHRLLKEHKAAFVTELLEVHGVKY